MQASEWLSRTPELGELRLLKLEVERLPSKRGKFTARRRQPFDMAGSACGVAVACEVKSSADSKRSLPIVESTADAAGIALHQLGELVAWHRAGAFACVAWRRGSTWLRIDGGQLEEALAEYEAGRRKSIPDSMAAVLPEIDGAPWLLASELDRPASGRRRRGTLIAQVPPDRDDHEQQARRPAKRRKGGSRKQADHVAADADSGEKPKRHHRDGKRAGKGGRRTTAAPRRRSST